MENESQTAARSRSKLEFLYRDLLIEHERLQAVNAEMMAKQREAMSTVAAYPGMLQKALGNVSADIANDVIHKLQHATTALDTAALDLQRTQQHLQRWSLRHAGFVASVAAIAGLVGGLLGALVILVLLQG